ncbi:glycerol-3-phosphate 1-O-acyltransferase PlsY [Mycoplasmopsis felifaucium]|uniref:glycerol-3-phosphate 1-O-acyltransferase PlsY n=1 Tax=Mycoplasmopsis felifaucium TaxID=35768 RepID=UPI0004899854|nr:glycerol-3-phosphate 1-O-acyltransferase PlsY [Mycoplasmopsis felifaucium]
MTIFYSILLNLLLVLIGYFCIGSFNTSIILSKKLKKDDIRQHNSKNAGATNSLRTYGKKFALIVFFIDVLKALIPILILALLFNLIPSWHTFSRTYYISFQSIGLGVVFGHVFPIYYRFKGGKGVACSIGVIISINIILFLLAFILFMTIALLSKYVSLASILTASILVLFVWIPWLIDGPLGFWINNVTLQYSFIKMSNYWFVSPIIYTIIATLVVVCHHSNIKRLINHQESKLKSKKS